MSVDDDLRRWVESLVGGTVTSTERNYTGGSRELWFVEMSDATGAPRQVVVRSEVGGGSFAGTELSLEREAALYAALASTAVPTPQLLGVREDGTALLMERSPGTSDLASLCAEEQRRVFESFMAALGELHRLDPATLGLDGMPQPSSAQEHALIDLRMWRGLLDGALPVHEPLLDYAFGWLHAHAPDSVQRTVLVHGDLGPGNFVAHEGQVTALVDWEMAHVGDPMDDLAWLEQRAAHTPLSGFSDTQELRKTYERTSGLTVDEEVLAYYRIFVQLRLAVISGMAIGRGGGVLGLAPYVAFHHEALVQLGGSLGTIVGAEARPVEVPAPVAGPRDAYYARVLEILGEQLLPAVHDRGPRRSAREAMTLVRHLRALDGGLAAVLDTVDRQERAALSPAVTDDDEALVALAAHAGSAADPLVLGYLQRRSSRLSELWQRAGAR